MKAVIEINMDNAAFEEVPGVELARILRELAGRLDESGEVEPGYRNLRDINGNGVGFCQIQED